MKSPLSIRRLLPLLFLSAVIPSFWSCTSFAHHQDKLWLHRCNSLEKMEEQEDLFSNIEVDLVYRGNGIFDVTHDADTTFGLHLNPYFAEIAEDEGHLWLDIKNVTPENCEEMEEDLDSLCEHYDVDKDQLIVEGKNWEALETFTENDFYTSYYVPFDKPSRLTDEEIDASIDSLQTIADSKTVSALSFPGWWYPEIKDHLDRPIDLLTWKHRTTPLQFRLSPRHFEMLNNPQLKVILLKSKGHYHR